MWPTTVDNVIARYPQLFQGNTAGQGDESLRRTIGLLLDAMGGTGDPQGELFGVERICNRFFEKKSYTEYFSSDGSEYLFLLKAWPVQSITNVWIDPEGVFDEPTKLTTEMYRVRPETGELIIDRGMIYVTQRVWLDNIKVQYQGGLAAKPEAMPMDIQLAVADEVARRILRDANLGQRSVSTNNGSVSFLETGEFLASTMETLMRYRTPIIA